jgi:predicted ATPase
MMLTKVEIKNYRGFSSYRMEGLAQVNLLVGKNNSGKTALLEGIQFLISGGDTNVLTEATKRRGEFLFSAKRSKYTTYIEVKHFFHGHDLTIDSSFSISGNDDYKPVTVKVIATKNHNGKADFDDKRLHRYGVLLQIEDGNGGTGKEIREFRLNREGAVEVVELEVSPRSQKIGVGLENDSRPIRFISTNSLQIGRLAAMWDDIILLGLEHEISKALQVLNQDVQSIHFLSGISSHGFFSSPVSVVVGLKNNKQRIPLGSMGDGMHRLLSLATCLACTSNGALFIDEIDTGLHYSIMSDMWKLVVDRAVNTNVQVFATTHSWDCIEGLSLLCQREPQWIDKVAIHTIDRTLEHSVLFKGESIVRMAKHHIDPR